MKRPSEAGRLSKHHDQAFRYWRNAADTAKNVPAPRFVVLCAFRRFEIWEPGAYPAAPRAEFDLIDLPEQLDALSFLADREPVFRGTQEAVTRAAVRLVVDLYAELGDRRAAAPDELRALLLQSVWCLFAEDLGQLEERLFTRLIDDLIVDPRRSSADDLGGLFEWLNRPGDRPPGGLYARTRYVNGGLFEQPAHVHLTADELRVLRLASEYDWRKVEPHIFGSLLQDALGPEARRELGAHYTHEVDIQKVVGPSVVEPWRRRIESADSIRELRRLQSELLNYVVLDPACGSGNFLYVAYRELRRLEHRLGEREAQLRREEGRPGAEQSTLSAFFPLQNMKGLDIDSFAVSLARVTLWMAHKLSVDELDLDERTLPLEDLSGIRAGDALRLPWPKASVIIGNPPFHGDRNLRGIVGGDYIEWLKREFGAGVKDHCVYWFRKAADHLEPGQRAGLVGTNSISQNRGRSASLNYVVEQGGIIVDAVSTQDWPGEAAVDVSIVNWIHAPSDTPDRFMLDSHAVQGIDTALEESTIPIADVPVIRANRGRAFQGVIPRGDGFVLTPEEAEGLLANGEANYRTIVHPYLGGRDITSQPRQGPSRFIIDFGVWSLERAMQYPAALDLVRARVKPARDLDPVYANCWWRLWRTRPDLKQAVASLSRFIAGTATAKRVLFVWCEPDWRPSNATNVFALESDYAFGVLTSRVHTEWAAKKSSTLEDRIRYTPSSAFETFPWPQVTAAQRERIAAAARAIVDRRSTLCAENEIGLGRLYDLMDEGAFTALAAAHHELNAAVIGAYGWSPSILEDTAEPNRRLYELNATIVADPGTYKPY